MKAARLPQIRQRFMSEENQRPEWVPADGGKEFTTTVMKGIEGGHDGMENQTSGGHVAGKRKRKKKLSVEDYVQGVLKGDRTILARTITLIESNATRHQEMAQEVLKRLLPHTGNSMRVGITGVPGAGKSTFIDTFGTTLCKKGYNVAVLAVDPSSSLSGGSILGDKTRMENLSVQKNCFIRPSPSGCTLGGVSRKTRETMLVCEAAGFDVILIETVGVGQSEAIVRTMVDFFLLVTLTGAGDELQSFKKGVIELADAILVNKADGDNEFPAQRFAAEFNHALHYLSCPTKGWTTKARCCSALTGEGIAEAWDVILEFQDNTQKSGVFFKRRQQQMLDWLHEMVMGQLKTMFFNHPSIREKLPVIEQEIIDGETPVTLAAETLLREIYPSNDKEPLIPV